MAPCSEFSDFDVEKSNTRTKPGPREFSPVPGPNGRANLDDFLYVGGRFGECEGVAPDDIYPPQLEFSEEEKEEEAENQSHSHLQCSSSSTQSSQSRSGSVMFSSSSKSASPLTPRTPTMPRAYLLPYLRDEDFRFLFPDCNEPGRSRSLYTHSSEQYTGVSSYTTAVDYPPSNASTPITSNENENGNENEDDSDYGIGIGRSPTPYFTPSHTPSHRSLDTEENDENEGRAPESPLPWTTYDFDA